MVFGISVIIILAFVIWGLIAPDTLAEQSSAALSFTTETFGWFYLITALVILIFCFVLAFGTSGHITLGNDDDEPEYSNISWFAMLFSAGMGIGLVFWGVAEPISHYVTPPTNDGMTPGAAREALRYSFFHWGLHPWGIYTLVSLGLAYFTFRKGYKGLISWTFQPLLGDRVNGPIGKTIDILAIIATAFGVATSLGLGVMQINGGLTHMFGIPSNTTVQIIIIAIVTVLFLTSAVSGLDKGIRILSNTNLLIALGLLIFTLVLGPTSFIFDSFTTTLGGYLQNIIQMSLRLTPFTEDSWVASWTLFYWAWWIAWAPFVGSFIARVSRGRTIREFVLGTLLLPSGFSFIWFSVFGATSLKFEMFDGLPIAESVKQDITSALFITLDNLPWGMFLAMLATLLIVTFFITSADSATFVLGMMSSNGNPNPSVAVKLAWGIFQSLIAIVLLLSGGLEALQTASILTALPFAVILLGMCLSLAKALRKEEREWRLKEKKRRRKLDKLLEQDGG
ncbi:glycine betaine uptake BCCT transporter [Paenibacillus apiarius]|uniref:BCCT family transporter n=1 Tax=Paenibacillus apiarius TaxID=46240 RepID=A0ABT4DZX9_9BACL|nr:BCCT family transporter [Paenibacillus apiarius]MCY9515382.1 BCCT family transporter [Paenibacillus apiarius]MCY9521838.1 BCCT family transporter [Paenibacillus apiarius]MCY9550231.1 BCCT family transporter [Paenibacillus apiarius]MCY9559507.1 BCCT family transporter [Paenibacillus apiarius]MCY9686875.1 BCCT family transporter [Paenibacillus apiarius]